LHLFGLYKDVPAAVTYQYPEQCGTKKEIKQFKAIVDTTRVDTLKYRNIPVLPVFPDWAFCTKPSLFWYLLFCLDTKKQAKSASGRTRMSRLIKNADLIHTDCYLKGRREKSKVRPSLILQHSSGFEVFSIGYSGYASGGRTADFSPTVIFNRAFSDFVLSRVLRLSWGGARQSPGFFPFGNGVCLHF
jgi:hypothetical protein